LDYHKRLSQDRTKDTISHLNRQPHHHSQEANNSQAELRFLEPETDYNRPAAATLAASTTPIDHLHVFLQVFQGERQAAAPHQHQHQTQQHQHPTEQSMLP
jgi:hypothetical protein